MLQQYSKRVLIMDDLLSENDCNELINFFKVNSNRIEKFNLTNVVPVNPSTDLLATAIAMKINYYAKKITSNSLEIDWAQLVEYPVQSEAVLHYDEGSSDTVFTSISYLNDNYSGGETFFENDIKFTPKKGRTIFFDGLYYKHGVTKISDGTRYTLPIWYRNEVLL